MDIREVCCPHCGSDDLSVAVGKVYCNNSECLMWKDDLGKPIVAIRKSEFKPVKAMKNHIWSSNQRG